MHLIIEQQMVLFYRRVSISSNVILQTLLCLKQEICQFTDVFVQDQIIVMSHVIRLSRVFVIAMFGMPSIVDV